MRVLNIYLILVLLTACDSSSQDDDEDLTPLRGGQTVGGYKVEAFDGYPSLSADARHLVYISGRKTLRDENGLLKGAWQAFKIDLESKARTPIALSDGSHGEEHLVEISANALYYAIAARSDNGAKLIIGAFNKEDRQIALDDKFAQINAVRFSNDGRFLAIGFNKTNALNQIRIYELPATASDLSDELKSTDFALGQELKNLGFAPGSSPSYHLFIQTLANIQRVSFATVPGAIEVIYESDAFADKGVGFSVDEQTISFFEEVSTGKNPVYIEEGHEQKDALIKSITMRNSLQRIDHNGSEVTTPNNTNLGFSGQILSASKSTFQLGLFNEMYYCKATGTQSFFHSVIKIYVPGEASSVRIFPIQDSSNTFIISENPCEPIAKGSGILKSGVERISLNSGATADNFFLAIQSSPAIQVPGVNNQEIYLYSKKNNSFEAIAPNAGQ